MPTLLKVPISQLDLVAVQADVEVVNDDSITELPEDSFSFQRHRGILARDVVEGSAIPGFDRSSDGRDGPRSRDLNKSVTFDDSLTVFSTGKVQAAQNARCGLDLSLSYDVGSGGNVDTQSPFKTVLSPVQYAKVPRVEPAGALSLKHEHSWPHRDKYLLECQQYVKESISTFHSANPGVLQDYRTMSVNEKAQEQERVQLLLKRLGISKKLQASDDAGSQTQLPFNTVALSKSRPPTDVSQRRHLLNESISPYVSLPARRHDYESRITSLACGGESGNMFSSEYPSNDSLYVGGDKSELLLSTDDNGDDDDDYGAEPTSRMTGDNATTPEPMCARGMNESLSFPINDNGHADSDSSIEVVRRNTTTTDDEKSYETPEDQIGAKLNGKRSASSSGRRGEDLHRTRRNEDISQPLFKLIGDEFDLAARLGELSISPPPSSPPRDVFFASQSPINPRLPYSTPRHEHSDDFRVAEGGDEGISLGGDSRGNKMDLSSDSLLSYTPAKSHQNFKDKLRAFREVPANVALKEGAVFHVGKLEVKHAQRPPTTKQPQRTKAAKSKTDLHRHRHRLINFPDPFVRYNNRERLALKEIFTWIIKAEFKPDEGESDIAAAGAFFSLSDDQIIAIGTKLFLHDASRGTGSMSRDSSSSLRGGTIVIVRSKEDTAAWESALREGTGCSVLNHASLTLSERIRSSTSERACMYDIVLSTYDAMKSHDHAIPVDQDGRAITREITADGGWHASRSSAELDAPKRTMQLSVLHRVQFKRIIFVDALGRKCFLAKGKTARASASVALNGESRLVFFGPVDGGGSSALRALRKSDKGAFRSVSAVLHLPDSQSDRTNAYDDDDDDSATYESALEAVAVDFKDLLY